MQGKIIVIISSCLHMLSHIKAVGSKLDKNIHPSIKTWMLRAMYEVIECMFEFSLFCSCSLSEDVNMELVEEHVPCLMKFFTESSDVFTGELQFAVTIKMIMTLNFRSRCTGR